MSAPSKWMIVAAFALALLTLASSQPLLAQVDTPSSAAAIPPFAPDAALPLNHFFCYQITTSQPVSETVRLQDQFDTKPKKAKVGAAVRLCNPVQKTHDNKVTEILYPNDHLLLYRIGTHRAEPSIEVQVRNQFGVAQLAVYTPAEVLMVPTRKLPHGRPKDTDHFKCYAVQGQPLNVPVILKDQFQQKQTLVLSPFALCNPTRKFHKDRWTEIKHPDAHLVCYQVEPAQFTKKVTTINQFRREDITAVFADLLCVPSRKKIL